MDNTSLAQKMIKKLDDPKLNSTFTVDDFFEECGIPENQRSDFAFASIMKQACEILGKRSMHDYLENRI